LHYFLLTHIYFGVEITAGAAADDADWGGGGVRGELGLG